jgi:serine/threonine protein kinase
MFISNLFGICLQYLHDRMVCHRDIKPENLLVIDRLHTKSLKLADFGLAVTVREPLFTVCGTPTYVAPEILAETGYGVKVRTKKHTKSGYFCIDNFVIFEYFRENAKRKFS